MPSRPILSTCVLSAAWLLTPVALSAQTNGTGSESMWNFFITLIVVITSGCIAALAIAASRQWGGYWRGLALLPLLILAIWTAIIVLRTSMDPVSPNLWPLEIFAWSMGTVVYLVILLTAKKAFLKADEENNKTD